MQTAPFKSSFAIVDVKGGRAALARRIQRGPVRVRIDILLDNQHSRDDGTSIEFSGEVVSVKEFAR